MFFQYLITLFLSFGKQEFSIAHRMHIYLIHLAYRIGNIMMQ